MKILYITNKPIFPIVDGGCKAMHQLLKCLLHNDYEIQHICFSTHKHPFELKNYPKTLLEHVPTKSYSIQTRIKVWDALKHLFTNKSYVVSRFDSIEVHAQLQNELETGKFTHVVLESLFVSPYVETIKKFSKAKIIVRTHNVEHLIWEQYAAKTPNPLKKWYLKKLSLELKNYELNVLNTVDLIATITDKDKSAFINNRVQTPIFNLPVAIEQQGIHVDYYSPKLFFLGSMNWQPNIEAVDRLTKEIFPAVKLINPKVELHLAGSFMHNSFKTDKTKGITNHGFVPSSSDFMQNHGILVLPILTSSGIRMKLLEAMSLGIPVVSTSAGALGINDWQAIEIANSTEEIVQKVNELLHSPEKRAILGQKAYKYIAENYSIDRISTLIRERFEKL